MALELDRDTIERLRALPATHALAEVREAIQRLGAGSEDFADACAQLVAAGVLTWAEIDALEH